MFGKYWDEGERLAFFEAQTNGPEGRWEVELKRVVENGRPSFVVYDPFAQRLMWFNADRVGIFEARRAYANLVELALCDAGSRKA